MSDKCARSCSCMCPRCRQLAAFPLPPGAPWASRQPSRLKSHRTPRNFAQVCGQQGRRASRANLQCGGLPRSCRRRPWRACWPEPSGEPPCTPHTSPRHSCSLTHTLWLLARAHCRRHSGQRWTAQFARQDKQLHSANARTALGAPRLRPRAPPLPPSDQHVQHWSLRERMGGRRATAQGMPNKRNCDPGARAHAAPRQAWGAHGQQRTASRRAPSCAALRALWRPVWYDPWGPRKFVVCLPPKSRME